MARSGSNAGGLSTDAAQKCGSSKGRKKVYGKGKPAPSPPVPEHERVVGSPRRAHRDVEFDFLVETVQTRLQEVTLDDAIKHVSENKSKETADPAGGSGCVSGEVNEVNTPSDGKDAKQVLDAAPESLEKPQPKRRTKHKKARPPTSSTGYVDDKTVNLYVQPILDEAITPIATKGVQDFAQWARGPGDCFQVDKIAEGSYGEVYQLRLREDLSTLEISKSRLSKLKAYDAGVFKIVPLRAKRGPGSKKFTTVDEIVSEVRLLKLLDPVPGFVRFREVHVVQGRFPAPYQRAWTEYSKTKDDCFNPDPAKKASYPDSQLWAVLEMDYAGHELEKCTFSTVSQIYDMFWGVALGLARAEQLSRFEHRDLHLGNICVKLNSPKPDFSQTGFGSSGLETTIIDYSLSRADFPSADRTDSFGIAWSDLDKKGIFSAVGRDPEEVLLRDTYRRMRSHIYQNNFLDEERPPKVPRQWESYNPGTNLIWLSFVLRVLLMRYKSSSKSPSRRALGERDANRQMVDRTPKASGHSKTEQCDVLGTQKSDLASQILDAELLERLEAVVEFFDTENVESTCAGDLVATAIGLQWLDESDFLC